MWDKQAPRVIEQWYENTSRIRFVLRSSNIIQGWHRVCLTSLFMQRKQEA